MFRGGTDRLPAIAILVNTRTLMTYTKSTPGSWRGVADTIRERVSSGEFPVGAKLPAESELVRQLEVSKLTVHRALRELAREGLLKRIERVGTFVQGERGTAQKRIGLVLPTVNGFLEIEMLAGLRCGLGDLDQIVLYSSFDDPVAEAEILARIRDEVDGMLVLPTCHPRNTEALRKLHASGFPLVCIDRLPTSGGLWGVATANYEATKEAMRSLLDRGHRRIMYLGFQDPNVSAPEDRYRAFCDFVREHLDYEPSELTRFVQPRTGVEAFASVSLVEDSLRRLTSTSRPVSAVFCVNEYYLGIALEVRQALPRPLNDELEVVAFCDWPSLVPMSRVGVVRQDSRAIGQRAIDLLRRIADEPGACPETVEVPATLIAAEGFNMRLRRPRF
jgi:DNA-binding LacI/PurR family transcriptional regulator